MATNFTKTFTVFFFASDKDHAKGETVYATIERDGEETFNTTGVSVQSATINMQATAEDLADVFKKVDTAARKGRWQKPRGNMLFFPQTGT